MSIWERIVSNILGHGGSPPVVYPPHEQPPPAITEIPVSGYVPEAPPPPPDKPPAKPPPHPVVDIAQVLDGYAAKQHEKLDWRRSIVDLLKVIDLDSSITARRELASELGYPGNPHGPDTAAMNIWLQQRVLSKLQEHGGKL